jgi:hypothetical protein
VDRGAAFDLKTMPLAILFRRFLFAGEAPLSTKKFPIVTIAERALYRAPAMVFTIHFRTKPEVSART